VHTRASKAGKTPSPGPGHEKHAHFLPYISRSGKAEKTIFVVLSIDKTMPQNFQKTIP
jgi:hypothetical protein